MFNKILIALAGIGTLVGGYFLFVKKKDDSTAPDLSIPVVTDPFAANRGKHEPVICKAGYKLENGKCVSIIPLVRDPNALNNGKYEAIICKAGYELQNGVCTKRGYEATGNTNDEIWNSALSNAGQYIMDSSLTSLQKTNLSNTVSALISTPGRSTTQQLKNDSIQTALSSGKSLTGIVLEYVNNIYHTAFGSDSPLKVCGLAGYAACAMSFDGMYANDLA